MNENQFQNVQEQQRSNWVRLSTLVLLRWFAIVGQILALLVAVFAFGLQVEIIAIISVIAASLLANILLTVSFPKNQRLSEQEATVVFLFDIAQLGLLLGITGGLNNPFALLMLAPVTIASTALRRRNLVIVGAFAILMASIVAIFNVPIRAGSGIPLILPDLFLFGFWISLLIGVVFLSVYTRRVTSEMHEMGDALLATQIALSREQKLTDLGGVVAATAHELGTPLATIKLVSSEMAEDYADNPNLLDDVRLIKEQDERCREILHSMGRAGKRDSQFENLPIEAVMKEAAEPHIERGKLVLFDVAPDGDGEETQPSIARRPEVIHGLRNLVQNAVDFASERVEIAIGWTSTEINIRITDDGKGFPISVLGRIGEPFVGSRRFQRADNRRPEYKGMGLGLFIAKTLLERSGAKLSFSNEPLPSRGASVLVVWKRSDIEVELESTRSALGENTNISY
jgi:two-component system sensor histidine kinase RegB